MTDRNRSGTTAKRVRILIVDDHPMVRDGLAMHIATEPEFEVCGQAEDVPDALTLIEAEYPDVAIIDISLKSGHGIELIKHIRARGHQLPILVWSMHPENMYAERALRAGAQGYLHKGQATGKFFAALRTVLAGNVYVSDEMSHQLLTRAIGGTAQERSPLDALTDREMETFELLGQGLDVAQIGKHLHISPKTVEAYRTHIKEKLGLETISQLIQKATQWVLKRE